MFIVIFLFLESLEIVMPEKQTHYFTLEISCLTVRDLARTTTQRNGGRIRPLSYLGPIPMGKIAGRVYREAHRDHEWNQTRLGVDREKRKPFS